MFTPHKFETRVAGIPSIRLTPEAYQDIWILVDEVKTEVGWLGSVSRKGMTFTIDKIYLLKQEVHGATTELMPEGIADLVNELMAAGPQGLEDAQRLFYWGHSHVDMGTSPSAQDETQMKLFQDNECEYYIRGIHNKKGRMEFDVFFYVGGKDGDVMIFRDVPWCLTTEVSKERRDELKKEITDKVKPLVATTPVGGAYSYQGGYQGGGYGDWTPGRTPVTTGAPPKAGDTKRSRYYIRGKSYCPSPYDRDETVARTPALTGPGATTPGSTPAITEPDDITSELPGTTTYGGTDD